MLLLSGSDVGAVLDAQCLSETLGPYLPLIGYSAPIIYGCSEMTMRVMGRKVI